MHEFYMNLQMFICSEYEHRVFRFDRITPFSPWYMFN